MSDTFALEGNPLAFQLCLNQTVDYPVIVHFETYDGTAIASEDYVAQASWITINAGTYCSILNVATYDDGFVLSGDRYMTLEITSVTNGGFGDSQGSGTILDSEPTIRVEDAAPVSEGGLLEFSVLLSSAVSIPTTIIYETVDGTAISPDHYEWHQAFLTFNAGETHKSVFVQTWDDAADNENRTVFLQIESCCWLETTDNEGLGIIVDNDARWSVSVETTKPLAFETGETLGEFTFTRTGDTADPLVVAYTFDSSSTAVEGVHFTSLGQHQVTIPAGEPSATLTITPIDDDDVGPEKFLKLLVLDGEEYIYLYDPNDEETCIDSNCDPTVTIENDDRDPPWQPLFCNCTCGCDTQGNADPGGGFSQVSTLANQGSLLGDYGSQTANAIGELANYASANQLVLGALRYASTWNPHPIVTVDVAFPESELPITSIETLLSVGTVTGEVVYYDPSGLVPGTDYRFANEVDASDLLTDAYEWSFTVTARYADGDPLVRTYHGSTSIRNLRESEFGNRWSLVGLDWLKTVPGGLLVIEGSGNMFYFESTGTNTWSNAPGDANEAKITLSGGNYKLRLKTGEESIFDPDGKLIERHDRAGNVSTYHYVSGTRRLSYAEDAVGRRLTLGYNTDEKLASITDPYGRVTEFEYDADGHMTLEKDPDPDGAGPLPRRQVHYEHDADTGLLTKYWDTVGEETVFTYYDDRTIESFQQPGMGAWHYKPFIRAGLAVPETGEGTEESPAPLLKTVDAHGEITDPLGNTTLFTTDRYFGMLNVVDAAGNPWQYTRDEDGRITSVTGPDPEGPDGSPVTTYAYDENGNLTSIAYPDGSSESWTYDATFGQPTSFTDARGSQTVFTLNSIGQTTRIQQAIGDVDPPGAQYPNDIITQLSYTTASAAMPGGLISSVTRPVSTNLAYNDRGNLTSVTYAAGSPDVGTVYYAYDTADRVSTFTDELGRQTQYAYDNRDRLTTLTLPDPDGSGTQQPPVYQYKHHIDNNLSEETDPLGRVTSYEYFGHFLTKVIQPDHDNDGNLTETAYTYDAAGQLSSVTDPLGHVTSYGYDVLGQLTTTTLPAVNGVSPVYTTAYDKIGRVKSTTDALGNVTTYAYANFGREVTMTEPDPDGPAQLLSPQSQFLYDPAGNLVSYTDPLGAVTTYGYNELGWLVRVDQPAATTGGSLTTWMYSYDKNGNLVQVIDPLVDYNVQFAHIYTFNYDARNRRITDVTRFLQPLSGGGSQLVLIYTNYQYNAAGERIGASNQQGQTSYQYDALGRLTDVTLPDPDGSGQQTAPHTSYKYDAAGQLTDVIDPVGLKTSYEYDALGHVKKVIDPGLPSAIPSTLYAYDTAGQVLSATNPLGNVTTYEYDALGRRTKGTDARNGTTTFAYDLAGNLLSLTDPALNTTMWQYDHLQRMISESDALGNSSVFVYDAAGQLTKKTDRDGRVTTYEYDPLGRNTAEKWLDGAAQPTHTFTYAFDKLGELTSASDPAAAYAYTYDPGTRQTYESQAITGLTPLIEYSSTYDDVGNRTSLQAVVGGAADFKNTYIYDNLSRLTSLQQSWTGGNAVAQKRVDFKYDAAGRFTQIARYEDLAGTDHVSSSYYEYDGYDGTLFRLSHSTSETNPLEEGSALATYDFAYDLARRMTWMNSSQDGDALFTYDATNQLIEADWFGTEHYETYAYDANGNRRAADIDQGAANRLLQDANYRYEYDAEGNRTARVDLSTGQRTEYTWDYRNRLTEVAEKQPTGTVDTGGRGTDWDWGSTSGTVYVGDSGGSGTQTSGPIRLQVSTNPPLWQEYHASVSNSVTEGGQLQLVLWAYTGLPQDLEYSFSGGTATAWQDYAAGGLNDWPINTIMAGSGSGRMIWIPTYADSVSEGVETVEITVQVSGHPETAIVLTAEIRDLDVSGGSGGEAQDGPILFKAAVRPAIEGSPVQLYLAAPEPISVEGWLEDVSAHSGNDYVDSNPSGIDFSVYVLPGQPVHITIPTFDNTVHEHTKSFRIVVQPKGDPARQFELEADIFDNDMPYTTESSVAYAYDVFDRLVKRTEDVDGAGPTAPTNTFLSWENGQLALHFDGSTAATLSHRYLYGPAVDQILADERVLNPSQSGGILWPLADQLGTPRDVVTYNSHYDVTIPVNHRTYDSFGNLLTETNTNYTTLIGYAGGLADITTGLTYFRARWLDPKTGRWISEDPISFAGGDTNLSRYVGNAPTNFVDPSGLLSWPFGSGGGSSGGGIFGGLFGSGGSRGANLQSTRGALMDELRNDASVGSTVREMKERYEQGKHIAEAGQRAILNIAPGLGQALDGAEAITGKNLLDEKCSQLSFWDRAWRGAWAFGPMAVGGVLGVIGKMRGAKAAGAAAKAAKVADAAADTACPSARAAHNIYVQQVRPGAVEKAFHPLDNVGRALGSRRYDDFDYATRTAFEGNTTPWANMTFDKLQDKLSQVAADIMLLANGQVDRVIWFGTEALPRNGYGGQLREALELAGIPYWVVIP